MFATLQSTVVGTGFKSEHAPCGRLVDMLQAGVELSPATRLQSASSSAFETKEASARLQAISANTMGATLGSISEIMHDMAVPAMLLPPAPTTSRFAKADENSVRQSGSCGVALEGLEMLMVGLKRARDEAVDDHNDRCTTAQKRY